MNEIKLSGKIMKVVKLNDIHFTRIILGLPLHMKVLNKGSYENCYSYISFLLFEPCNVNLTKIKKGTNIELTGWVLSNSESDDDCGDELAIMLKTFRQRGQR